VTTLDQTIRLRILIAVQSTPTDEDLKSFMEYAVKHREQYNAVILVATSDSDSLTSRQKKYFVTEIQRLFHEDPLPVAVMTQAYAVRMVTGIIGWTLKMLKFKSFPPFRDRGAAAQTRPSSLVPAVGWIVKVLSERKTTEERAQISKKYLNTDTIETLDGVVRGMLGQVTG